MLPCVDRVNGKTDVYSPGAYVCRTCPSAIKPEDGSVCGAVLDWVLTRATLLLDELDVKMRRGGSLYESVKSIVAGEPSCANHCSQAQWAKGNLPDGSKPEPVGSSVFDLYATEKGLETRGYGSLVGAVFGKIQRRIEEVVAKGIG